MSRNVIYICVLLVLGISTVYGHVNNPLLPEGCGSCHVGHGIKNEPMLVASEEQMCYLCHGSGDNASKMKSYGKLAPAASPKDIESEFEKLYRHPVEERLGHSPAEKLPAANKNAASHSECVDCHNPHQRIQAGGKAVYEVTGYSLSGQYLETALHEYEICFKCHYETEGGRSDARSVYREFSLSVASQHPVTKVISQRKSASLLASSIPGVQMKCSDCHTNDDPDGPRGPHGSNNRFMLSGNYDTDIYADESPFTYEFCYSCHDRNSILDNESFPLHREHIVGDLLSGIRGTSCFTCHASHSSQSNANLIEFNTEAVSRESRAGRISYIETGDASGECYLRCHGHEHSPGKY